MGSQRYRKAGQEPAEPLRELLVTACDLQTGKLCSLACVCQIAVHEGRTVHDTTALDEA